MCALRCTSGRCKIFACALHEIEIIKEIIKCIIFASQHRVCLPAVLEVNTDVVSISSVLSLDLVRPSFLVGKAIAWKVAEKR